MMESQDSVAWGGGRPSYLAAQFKGNSKTSPPADIFSPSYNLEEGAK